MALEIVHFGTPVLHQKGEPITEFDESLKSLFDDMVETCIEAEGSTGGSSNWQNSDVLRRRSAGHRDRFRLHPGWGQAAFGTLQPDWNVQPDCDQDRVPKTIYEERVPFLSDIRGDVERTDWIRCQYQDIDGNPHELECNGLLGRCVTRSGSPEWNPIYGTHEKRS